MKGISEDGTYNMQGVREADQHGREDMPSLRNIGTRQEEGTCEEDRKSTRLNSSHT